MPNWIKSLPIYGQPIAINQLVYTDGTYLAFSENHPNQSSHFQTIITSIDLEHWQHRPTGDVDFFGSEKSNACLCSDGDKFFVALTINDQFEIHSGTNGFDWEKIYISDDASPSLFEYETGILFVGGLGYIKLSTDHGKTWLSLKVPDAYKTSSIVDLTVFNGRYFFLVNNENNSHSILFTQDGNTVSSYDLNTSKTINAITSTDKQIILVASDSFLYSNDGMTFSSWKTISANIPQHDNTAVVATMYDAVFYDNMLIVVGSYEFKNNSGIKFSSGAFISYITKEITYQSVFEIEKFASHLNVIKVVNNKLTTFGQSFPNGENCFWTLG